MFIVKRGLILLAGIAIEVAVLWALCYFSGKRIRWNNVTVYIVFVVGFLTAYWLQIWSKIMKHFFNRSQIPEATTPVQTSSAPMSPAAIPQQTEATPTVENAVAETPAPTEPVATGTAPTPAPVPGQRPKIAPPIRMNVQNNAILSVKPPEGGAPSPAAPVPPVDPATNKSSKEQDINTLADIDPDLDMMAFKHVALEGKIIDLVYSSDDVAVLCKLFSEPHTWTVDTTQPIEACTWTDETGASMQPCAALLTQREALKKMEPSAEILPTLVMIRGSIQNYQQVQDYLLQNQITLVQYKNESMPDVKELHQLLKDNFSLFPDDPALNDELDQTTE
ncbi:MAG: hypothetical protein II938_00725 [Alphaproteobacteria bacterium]|nr:hypothetical protein [Alphaproteobacteria bacterium]